jgi:general secretion pathway protein G
MRCSERGMTLGELMIVLVVAGLLASVGVPTYRTYVDRARVARAVSDIGGIAIQLYRWQLNMREFPETLAEAGLDGQVDPWGHPYTYLNVATATTGQVRRDRNLHPLNTDFDLYSNGPDGATQTQLTAKAARDDIVRANNGGYIGVAANY